MRLLVLASAPLLERHAHKTMLLDRMLGLLDDPSDALVVSDNGGLGAQLRIALAQGSPADVGRKARALVGLGSTGADAGRTPAPAGSLVRLARERGCRVETVARLDEALAAIRRHVPDLGVNLGVSFIPEPVLEASRLGTLGLHYGSLPRVRGGDTIRWSVLIGAPLEVCVLRLEPALDMGRIVGRRSVPLHPGDTTTSLRARFQSEGSELMYECVARARDTGSLEGDDQAAGDGSTFFRMGSYLRTRVDCLLASDDQTTEPGSAS